MARTKRPATAGPEDPTNKAMRRQDDSSDSDEEVDQSPRRSARLAAKNGEAGAAPAANSAPARAASQMNTRGTSNPVQQPTNANRMRSGPVAAPQRADPVMYQPRPVVNQRPVAMQIRRTREVAERARREEEERAAERQRRRANQDTFDGLVIDWSFRRFGLYEADWRHTLPMARECLRGTIELHREITQTLDSALDGVDMEAAREMLNDADRFKNELQTTIDRLMREEEEKARRRADVEAAMRRVDMRGGQGVVKTEEEEDMMGEEAARKKNEEEEEEKRRAGMGVVVKKEEEEEMREEEARKKEEEDRRMEEIQERLRREASIIDKKCKICFDEIDDGRGCKHCKQILGCMICIHTWMKNDRSCPLCRRRLKNKEVVKIDDLHKPPVPLRRSTRLRLSGASTQ